MYDSAYNGSPSGVPRSKLHVLLLSRCCVRQQFLIMSGSGYDLATAIAGLVVVVWARRRQLLHSTMGNAMYISLILNCGDAQGAEG